MDTLIRSTTMKLGRRVNGYESLNGFNESNRKFYGRRTLSRRSKDFPQAMVLASGSFRRARAKQRQIFLRTYKLTSASRVKRSSGSKEKLNKAVVKLKRVVVSLVSFFRLRSLRSCNSRAVIDASSPTHVSKFC